MNEVMNINYNIFSKKKESCQYNAKQTVKFLIPTRPPTDIQNFQLLNTMSVLSYTFCTHSQALHDFTCMSVLLVFLHIARFHRCVLLIRFIICGSSVVKMLDNRRNGSQYYKVATMCS